MQREKITHKAIVAFFTTVSPVPVKIIKIDNEGRKGQTGGLAAEGFTPGAADTILIFPAQYTPSVVFAEIKTKTLKRTNAGVRSVATKQQNNQIEFQKDVERLGHTYWLLPGIDEAKALLLDWCKANGLKSRLIE